MVSNTQNLNTKGRASIKCDFSIRCRRADGLGAEFAFNLRTGFSAVSASPLILVEKSKTASAAGC